MQALWLENQVPSLCDNLPIPKPVQGEALIHLHKAGVCSTDLELLKGYYPFTGIPGHEFVGVVEECPGDPSWVGKRVVGEINVNCGVCAACRRGHPSHCERRVVLGIKGMDGVFAEYFVLPVKNLHLVPDSVSDDAAVFTEPLAAALEILEQVHIQPSNKVVVIGAGRLGQLVAQVLRLTGCELHVVARYPNQKEILELHQIPAIDEHDLGEGKFEIAIEATGSPEGLKLAQRIVRPRGMVILKSTYTGKIQINISSIVVNEITLMGSRCGPFKPALDLLRGELVDPIPLISARYSFAKGLDALEHAGKSGVIKVILENI
ncbi:alcohol dehydrogenase [bacterium SM23_57]|nr:MAG: alcohol dehydrogenase [bacterium SM23_57]